MSQKYLCIHGHFYQPPRENPWLDAIEAQPSAKPHHDWNERITAECYAPNARARVLGAKGRIRRLINNYEYMSFNIGPTLLAWLEKKHPEVYRRILDADRASAKRLNGHGNAVAQAYNHIIMPLANQRDQKTQIQWGLADFESRFGRKTEGMWLAETAVNKQTLSLLADAGVKYTILAPSQAASIRPIGAAEWEDVSGGKIDPRRPYRVFFDSKGERYIDLFFYDGPVSRAVAFERLLTSGSTFLNRLKGAAGKATGRPRLVHLATDGESYGHHFAFGEMALAWMFDHIEKNDDFKIINYGAFLELSPPRHEVEIFDDTAWSCVHGVERWRSDCGCCAHCEPGWNQEWRTPLRDGLNKLRDRLDEIFKREMEALLRDPQAARDDYIRVILKAGADSIKDAFLAKWQSRPLLTEERTKILQLMESQQLSMYMFTSCGWFFDDIAGLEPIQNLKYAAKAIELAAPWSEMDLKTEFLEVLSKAESNEPEYKNGDYIFHHWVETSRISEPAAAAHHALHQLIEECRDQCLTDAMIAPIRHRRLEGPGTTVYLCEVSVYQQTGDGVKQVCLAIHQGGLQLDAYAGAPIDGFDLGKVADALRPAVSGASTDAIVKIFQSFAVEPVHFGLSDLITDSRHALVIAAAGEVRDDFRAWVRDFFDRHQDILLLLEEAHSEGPDIPGFIYGLAVGDRLARRLEEGLGSEGLNWEAVRNLSEKSKTWHAPLQAPLVKSRALAYLKSKLESALKEKNSEHMKKAADFIELMRELKLGLDLVDCQDLYYAHFFDAEFMKTLEPGSYKKFMKLGLALDFSPEMLDVK